ncbi:putative MFS multidrug transporter [Lasiodiplodia theobromae]|uniref:putative MFS multidrug transporter n=1 Tax=Lasiodiplodia theobromae TaxID=45133 RepID=UPI0015C37FD1|nr:putative MFS multidrug transporter [Lasiodiplodia theobromae]KAF4546073.1 putative MFS multidrug transporter [Lasiodiplodia theobromae]
MTTLAVQPQSWYQNSRSDRSNYEKVIDQLVELEIIWQYTYVNDAIRHPRLVPYKGLGSVMKFTGDELMDVAELLNIWTNLNNVRGSYCGGQQDRNDFSDADDASLGRRRRKA